MIFETLTRFDLRKYALLGAIFFLLTTHLHAVTIDEGVLDLRTYNFKTQKPISLNGNWLFYWDQLLTPNELEGGRDAYYKQVPGHWGGDEYSDKIGKGTYVLKVLLPEGNQRLALKVKTIGTAMRLFVDGVEMVSAGVVGVDKASTSPDYYPRFVTFETNKEVLEVVLQVANFHHRSGGVWESLVLGGEQVLIHQNVKHLFWEIFLIGSFFGLGLYHLILNYRRSSKASFYFGLAALLTSIRLIVTDEVSIHYVFPNFPFKLLVSIEYLTLFLIPMVFAGYLKELFVDHFPKWYFKSVVIVTSLFCIGPVFFSLSIYSHLAQPMQIFIVIQSVFAITFLVKAVLKKVDFSLLVIVSFCILFLATVNDILFQNGVINTDNVFPFSLLIFIYTQAYILSARFSKAFYDTKSLTRELAFTNENLERIVDERTEEIQQRNEEITVQRDEAHKQRDVIERQNVKLRDSIVYAQRIQSALLPSKAILEKHFEEHFLLFRPRDIVSGDFYWFKEVENYIIIAVADCTGHGVPGAFMSILGINFLDELTIVNKSLSPNVILDQLRDRVKESLLKDDALGNKQQRDGMDMALYIIDTNTLELTFSGAYNPLVLIRNNELDLIKGNRQPVGKHVQEKPFDIVHKQLEKGDLLYTFSDGFADQTGGPSSKKYLSKRFRAFLYEIREESLDKQLTLLEDELDSWQQNIEQVDDILVMGVKV